MGGAAPLISIGASINNNKEKEERYVKRFIWKKENR
jgi:hypothetical protein